MYDSFENKQKVFTNVVTKEPVDVIIQTTTYKILGKVHVKIDFRFKDEINTVEPFLAVTDAQVLGSSEEILLQTQFIAVGKSQIVWIIPQDEQINLESKA